MNIFILDLDHEVNARYHVDRHVVKMILEYAQLLSTASHLTGLPQGYRPTHIHHRCTRWVCESVDNWIWLLNLADAVNREWRHRYQHYYDHKSMEVIKGMQVPPLPDNGLTPFSFPKGYESDDIVQAYRSYYLAEKEHLFSWTRRDMPDWVQDKGYRYDK